MQLSEAKPGGAFGHVEAGLVLDVADARAHQAGIIPVGIDRAGGDGRRQQVGGQAQGEQRWVVQTTTWLPGGSSRARWVVRPVCVRVRVCVIA